MQPKHLHALAGFVLLALLPIASRAFGSGAFAWTMYSSRSEHRIDIHVKDASGVWHTVAPTGLADEASPGLADVLVAADHYRHGPMLVALEKHLADFARFACEARHGTEAEVVLWERRGANEPERSFSARATCP